MERIREERMRGAEIGSGRSGKARWWEGRRGWGGCTKEVRREGGSGSGRCAKERSREGRHGSGRYAKERSREGRHAAGAEAKARTWVSGLGARLCITVSVRGGWTLPWVADLGCSESAEVVALSLQNQ